MGLATYTYNRSTSGGEIITHLINSTDGTGLHFDGAAGSVSASPPNVGSKASFELIVQAGAASQNAYLFDYSSPRTLLGLVGGELKIYVTTQASELLAMFTCEGKSALKSVF